MWLWLMAVKISDFLKTRRKGARLRKPPKILMIFYNYPLYFFILFFWFECILFSKHQKSLMFLVRVRAAKLPAQKDRTLKFCIMFLRVLLQLTEGRGNTWWCWCVVGRRGKTWWCWCYGTQMRRRHSQLSPYYPV